MRLSLLFALAAAALLQLLAAAPAVAGPSEYENVASDTYYRFNVEEGTLDVVVEATVQAVRTDASEVYLWAMAGAEEISVRRGETALNWTAEPDPNFPDVLRVRIELDRKLATRARADFTLTYRVPAGEAANSLISPGAIALELVSQGTGSFVFVDMPSAGENYLDPGCLRVAQQPPELVAEGYERWVCGDTPTIALNTDDASVIRRCEYLDPDCRQRSFDRPYAAYAQSVTSSEQVGTLSAVVSLREGPVTLNLRHFRRDEDWARRQLEVAEAALPLLEDLFGYPFGGDVLELRESYQLVLMGYAGLAFPGKGEVLLAAGTGEDDAVTIHELAHQWAGYNLAGSWLWEGLASWATSVVGPQIGVPVSSRNWQDLPYDDPLAAWNAGSEVTDATYWYGKAEAFWKAYEEAVGGREVMTSILALSDVEPGEDPLDGRWFMNRGEEFGDTELDDLFLEYVFNPLTARSVLAERRAAIDAVAELEEEAAAAGLDGIPPDIAVNLEEWYFAPVAGQVAAAKEVIADYLRLEARAGELGVPPSEALAGTWASRPLAESAALVRDQEVALEAIAGELARLAEDPDPAGEAKVEEAMTAFAAGDFAAVKRLAAESAETAVSEAAASQMIDYAREAQASFSPNLFERIGMIGQDPEKHLVAAEQALALGNTSEALVEAQAAYDIWQGAQRRGLLYAGLAGLVMSLFSVVIWGIILAVENGTGAFPFRRPGKTGDQSWNPLPGPPPTGQAGSFWRKLDNRPPGVKRPPAP